MKKKIVPAAVITIAHFLICILTGALGWDIQMMAVSVCSVLAVFFSFRLVNPKLGPVLVIAPFYLVYTYFSIRVASYQTFPIWIWGFFLSAITYFLLHFKSRTVVAVGFISFLVWFGVMIIWPNNFSYLCMIKNPEKFDISKASLTDLHGNPVIPGDWKNKVVLLDLWHSACYSCIVQFPELQKLSDHYREDSAVKIICLNVPIERDKGVKQTKFTDKYSFLKYYFRDKESYRAFSGSDAVTPYTVILDKNGRCRFVSNGMLGNSWNIFIGNEKRIINKLKNEKT